MARSPRIRKGDTAYVVAGKDRGKSGRVLQVLPNKDRILVEGVNMVTRATKPNPGKNIKGGLVRSENPLHISNVAVLDPENNVPTRVGYKFLEDGSKVRVSRLGTILDKS